MTTSQQNHEADELPLEPWTALRAMTRHRRLVFMFSVLAASISILLARATVKENYAAEAVLLHTPLPGDERGGSPRLDTSKNLVEVLPNLREVIHRRQLDVTPLQLAQACEAETKRDSNVLAIRVTWPDPQEAAAIANELADVFLERQTQIRRAALKVSIQDYERQQARAQQALGLAADELGQFRKERGAMSVDDQVRACIAEISTIQGQLDAAMIDQKNLELQRASLPKTLQQVAKTLSDGKFVATGDASGEVARLRNAIEEDRRTRERNTALSGASVVLSRNKRLAGLGLVPRVDVEKAELEYQRARVLAEETPQTAAWRKQSTALEKSLSSTDRGSASAMLGPEVGLRAFSIEMDSVAMQDKIKFLTASLARTRASLAAFPSLQRAVYDLEGNAARYERELAALEDPLSKARRAVASDSGDFTIVSRALPLEFPVTRRKLMSAAGVSSGLMVMFLGLLGFREFGRGRIRSGRELAYVTRLPVFAHWLAGGRRSGAVAQVERSAEELTRAACLTRRLERSPASGAARILISGAATPDARQRAVDALLAQFILQGRRVAWISLVEGHAPRPQLAGYPSLHEYLRGEAVPSERLLASREVDAVAVIGGAAPVAPHLRSSTRMKELVQRASAHFDVVVLVGDCLLDAPDDLELAKDCDVVLLLAQAEETSREDARRLAHLVRDNGLPRCGWLLVDVHPDFAALDADRSW